MQNKRTILIYEDYVFNKGALYRTLKNLIGKEYIDFIDADDIKSGFLNPQQHSLLMPGGADMFYCEKLNGIGNKKIREFVENGGIYLGICAGSYYGCAELDWASNWDNEEIIKGKRELAFYSGKATGPIEQYCDKTKPFPEGYAPQICHISYDDGLEKLDLKLNYNGGPYFSEPNNNATVLARYSNLKDKPPAIIECKIGKGLTILSSPHIEDTQEVMKKVAYHRDNSYNRHQNIARQMDDNKEQLNKLWVRILEKVT